MFNNQIAIVGVLINCYNSGKYIARAIQSVLNQSYSNWKICIWDNQSDDNSEQVIRSFQDPRIKYFLAPRHTSLGEARKQAFSYVEGDWLAILDADDFWEPKKLELQLREAQDPDVGIVFGEISYLELDGKLSPRPVNYKIQKNPTTLNLLQSYAVPCPTIFIRKDVLNKLGMVFDPRWSFIEEYDLVLRASRQCKVSYIDQNLAITRLHPESASSRRPEEIYKELFFWTLHQILADQWSKAEKTQLLFNLFEKGFRYLVLKTNFIQLNKKNLS